MLRKQFRTGNFNLNDAERPGQPKKVEDEELEALLEENPCCTLLELRQELGVIPFKKKDLLHKIVICNEKWILYDNPKKRKSRISWASCIMSCSNLVKPSLLTVISSN